MRDIKLVRVKGLLTVVELVIRLAYHRVIYIEFVLYTSGRSEN